MHEIVHVIHDAHLKQVAVVDELRIGKADAFIEVAELEIEFGADLITQGKVEAFALKKFARYLAPQVYKQFIVSGKEKVLELRR